MEQPGDPAGDGLNTRLMRGIKLAMAVMGALIVAGFVYLGVEVYRRATDPEYRARLDERRSGRAPAAAVPRPGGPLVLPAGSEIVSTVAVGNRLAVTVRQADGSQILFFIHPGTDEMVESLRTQPAPR